MISAGVYRHLGGASRPFPASYEGDYFFSDYYTGDLTRLRGRAVRGAWPRRSRGQPETTHWATGLNNVADYLLGPDGSLWYCVQYDGSTSGDGEIRRIVTNTTVSVPSSQLVQFAAPFPSPAVGSVRLEFSLAQSAAVELAIYDLRGRRVRMLRPRSEQPAGPMLSSWDGRDDEGLEVAPAIYFVRLTVNGTPWTHRIPLIR